MPKAFRAQHRPHQDAPHILLVNPWIHDFAAYDVWSRPYGLLYLGGLLRDHGLRVSFIDCLDRFHPRATPRDVRFRHGRGPYLKTAIPKPKGLEDVPRTYSRYGIPPDWFRQDVSKLSPALGSDPGDLHHDLLVSGGGRNHRPTPIHLAAGAGSARRHLRPPVHRPCHAPQRPRTRWLPMTAMGSGIW